MPRISDDGWWTLPFDHGNPFFCWSQMNLKEMYLTVSNMKKEIYCMISNYSAWGVTSDMLAEFGH